MIEIESHIGHELGRTGAVKRVQEFVGSLPQRFPEQVHEVSMQVHNDAVEVRFAAYGYNLQWIAEVQESRIVLHGLIPDSAKKFQHKLLQTVVDRISAALQPSLVPMRRAG